MSKKMTEGIGLPADEDSGLVSRVRDGDPDAFESLLYRHQKKMFNIALRMIGTEEDAAEVVQDAFVAAYRGIASFAGTARFSTWLCSIVINLSRNRLRQLKARAGREPLSIDDPVSTEDGSIRVEYASNGPSIIDALEEKQRRRKVIECLASLEPEYREVVVLRDMQGFSYEEVCASLGIPEGTVKSRLFRARESLKRCIKKFVGEL
jgi:RNA polymerase sigma-70 factor (ECF subfamily)